MPVWITEEELEVFVEVREESEVNILEQLEN